MTIDLAPTQTRIVSAIVGAWLGIQLSVWTGFAPVVVVAVPLLALVGAVGAGRLLGVGLSLAVGLMAGDVVVACVAVVVPVTSYLVLPLVAVAAAAVTFLMFRAIRLVPVPAR